MSIDHFEKRQLLPGQIDWNFNLTFAGNSDVARMVNEYAPILTHPELLHKPVPPQWLHATVLRLGTTEQITESEALAVAAKVQEAVVNLELPEFRFDSWWLLFGNIVFHISPDDEFTKLYDIVTTALAEVVGKERASKTPHGRYLAHSTFAYAKTHQNEDKIHDIMINSHVEPARFRAAHMPLVRQWAHDGHYEWEVVKQIDLS